MRSCGAAQPCLTCAMSERNTIHKNKTQYGYHKYVSIVDTESKRAARNADAIKYAGLRELAGFICQRVRGEIADILLPDENRVEGLILDWVKQVEQRIAEGV